MFPYSSSPYPSSLFPSSSSSSSSNSSSILFPHFPFLNLDQNASSSNNNNNNTFFHDPLSAFPYIPLTHHHHHPIIPETLTTNLAVTTENTNNNNNNNNCVVTTTMPKLHHHDPPPLPPSSGGYGISCLLTKKPAKKDRHSKIYTSQGLRDRRVRLSIEIARKFFDLQDMLGFDKASNTLEWLFSKSKKAIKDLSKSKNNNNVSSNNTTSSSECEDCEVVSHQQGVFSTTDDTTTPNLQQQDAAKERNNSKLKRAQKEPACVRANKMKESREKARARARERTSNKICNNNNNNNQQLEFKKKFPASASNENNPQFLHNSRSQLVVGGTSEAQRDNNEFNVIEESIVIKRKLKPSLNMASHHHQNHVIFPKEASFINNNSTATHDYNHSFPTNLSSPNWDANNNNNGGGGSGAPTGRSNFCAIASMNLSTGLQIFGKSWEECTNPRLH